MYKVEHLPEAITDIFEIEEYLNQYSLAAADRFVETLDERAVTLAKLPYIWPVYEQDSFFRRMVIGDYLLFYSVDESRKLVIIHRIFHHSRDIDRRMMER